MTDEPRALDDDLAPLSDQGALRRRVERQLAKRSEFRLSLAAFIGGVTAIMVVLGMMGLLWLAAVIALGWGAGVAVHGIDTYYQTGARAARTVAITRQAFRDAYGPDWTTKAGRKQLRAEYNRTVQPINQRKELAMHTAAYALIIPMLWLIYANFALVDFPWPLVVMAGWGLGLAGHAISVWGNRSREDALQREIERQRALIAASGGSEKLKNEDLALDDDGELLEPDIADAANARQQSRR